jgi:hypothetical protein
MYEYGGIAVNFDCTLLAEVNTEQSSVYFFPLHLNGFKGQGVLYNAARDSEKLQKPTRACFALRGGAETLLVCDTGNHRVVEMTSHGAFLREIPITHHLTFMAAFFSPIGIDYSRSNDIIAVSSFQGGAVQILDYHSGVEKAESRITSRGPSSARIYPIALSFSTDGQYVVVVDYINCVSKFLVSSGEFVDDVYTNLSDCDANPTDVLCCDDGRVYIAIEQVWCAKGFGFLVCVDTANTMTDVPTSCICPYSLVPFHGGVLMRDRYTGAFIFLPDAWLNSSRCAWISAILV